MRVRLTRECELETLAASFNVRCASCDSLTPHARQTMLRIATRLAPATKSARLFSASAPALHEGGLSFDLSEDQKVRNGASGASSRSLTRPVTR